MFCDLWPRLPLWEVPISSITNGVHLPELAEAADLASPYTISTCNPTGRALQRRHHLGTGGVTIPAEELLDAHRRRKRRLVSFVRERQGASAARAAGLRRGGDRRLRCSTPTLLPSVRRAAFATYKRATRLCSATSSGSKRILLNKDMPVTNRRLAARRMPKDQPGRRAIIRARSLQLIPRSDLWSTWSVLEDYDMKVAGEMVQGVDGVAQTTRGRGEEACGTANEGGHNGVLNLSILDGWFYEAYAHKIGRGWAIGEREPYSRTRRRAACQRHYIPCFEQRDCPHVL